MSYEPVIGLEVHIQLKTQTKVFCGCRNLFGARENSNICPVCLGLPGSLPVLNKGALMSGAKVACALNCTTRHFIKFDRKNYFYPDLPKAYQISQFDMPISENGYLDVELDEGSKRIRIKRVHLEEDAGKLIHSQDEDYSFVDYNRAGSPLLEIVSEPDIFSSEEAYQYLSDLKLIIQYLGVSDCDMEKGSLRCDANISLRPEGSDGLGVKAELKNMNSFKAIKCALDYEIERQRLVLEEGGVIVQETRLWDESKEKTFTMRTKEDAHDYRYFPEPDLLPCIISEEELKGIRSSLPELPKARRERFVKKLGLSNRDASVIISDASMAVYFEKCLDEYPEPKKVVNWLIGPVSFQLNTRNLKIDDLGLDPSSLIKIIQLVEDGFISQLAGKDILQEVLDSKKSPEEIVKSKNLIQVSDTEALNKFIEDVISQQEKTVEDFKQGKTNALMFLVGQVMRLSGGKANPKIVKKLLEERLR